MDDELEIVNNEEGDTSDIGGTDGGDTGGDAHDYVSELYNISDVPEEYRPHVEEVAKAINSQVTPKFQEAADYRKKWEPFEELGLDQYEPEQVQALLSFAEVAADEDSFREWWEEIGDELGLTKQLLSTGLEDDEEEGDDITGEAGDDAGGDIESRIEKLLDERLSPLMEKEREQEVRQREAEAAREIDEKMEQFKNDNPDLEFDEEDIYKLALGYPNDPDALDKGLEDYKRIVGAAESGVVKRRSQQSEPPEGEGVSNTNQAKPSDWDSVAKLARERVRAEIGN